MKKITMSVAITLLLSVLLAGATFVAPVSAAEQLPFKGSLQAHEMHVEQFPILSVNARGEGNATHLGLYTVHYTAQVNLLTAHGSASIQFEAANGDLLFAAGGGQATPTGPDIFSIHEEFTITGGTGRFEGATGSFEVDRVLNMVTGNTSGTIGGTIVIHHGK